MMGKMVKEFTYQKRRWMDVRIPALKWGDLHRFFWVENSLDSAGRDVHCQVQQGGTLVRISPREQPTEKSELLEDAVPLGGSYM